MSRTGFRVSLLLIGALAGLACLVVAEPGHGGKGRGTQFVPFQADDDWGFLDPAVAFPLLVEAISCPGGEVSPDLNPPCPLGGNIKVRNLVASSQFTATDPRMTGTAVSSTNANFDSEYTGPVWGTWSLEVEGEDGVWEGTWHGKRRYSTDPEECLGFPTCWIGELKYVGSGSGGSVDGLQVMAQELIRTFTPLPAPYENICFVQFGGPCGLQYVSEGNISGRILIPGHK